MAWTAAGVAAAVVGGLVVAVLVAAALAWLVAARRQHPTPPPPTPTLPGLNGGGGSGAGGGAGRDVSLQDGDGPSEPGYAITTTADVTGGRPALQPAGPTPPPPAMPPRLPQPGTSWVRLEASDAAATVQLRLPGAADAITLAVTDAAGGRGLPPAAAAAAAAATAPPIADLPEGATLTVVPAGGAGGAAAVEYRVPAWPPGVPTALGPGAELRLGARSWRLWTVTTHRGEVLLRWEALAALTRAAPPPWSARPTLTLDLSWVRPGTPVDAGLPARPLAEAGAGADMDTAAFRGAVLDGFRAVAGALEAAFPEYIAGVRVVATEEAEGATAVPLLADYSLDEAVGLRMGTFRIAAAALPGGSDTLAYAYAPGGEGAHAGTFWGADMVFNVAGGRAWRQDADAAGGGYSVAWVAAHEALHALGLDHDARPGLLMSATVWGGARLGGEAGLRSTAGLAAAATHPCVLEPLRALYLLPTNVLPSAAAVPGRTAAPHAAALLPAAALAVVTAEAAAAKAVGAATAEVGAASGGGATAEVGAASGGGAEAEVGAASGGGAEAAGAAHSKSQEPHHDGAGCTCGFSARMGGG